MKFIKRIEKHGTYTSVYFEDELERKQGLFECYYTEGGVEPRETNLYYIEQYKDNLLIKREYTLWGHILKYPLEN